MSYNRNNNDCNNSSGDTANTNANAKANSSTMIRSLLSSARMNSLLDGEPDGIENRGHNGPDGNGNGKGQREASRYWEQPSSNEIEWELVRDNHEDADNHNANSSTAFTKHLRDVSGSVSASKEYEVASSSPSSSVGASVPSPPFGSKEATTATSTATDQTTSRAGCLDRARTRNASASASARVRARHLEREEFKRDNYVRSGTHFRSLLNNALQKVADGFVNAASNGADSGDLADDVDGTHTGATSDRNIDKQLGQKRSNRNDDGGRTRKGRDESSRPRRKRRLNHHDSASTNDNDDDEIMGNHKHASELAREKVAEVMNLKRALKEAEDHASAMTHANSALRDASVTSSARLGTLAEALRIAGEKAANARADADAAEARASSLATQLKSFQSVLNETKLTAESIKAEHDDIATASTKLEQNLLRAESELNRVHKEKRQIERDHKVVSEELEQLKRDEEVLRDAMERKSDDLTKLRKTIAERQDIESARQERTERLENDLKKARSVLVEMTSGAAEGESTMAALRETIHTLQTENEALHKNLEQSASSFRKERTKLQEALAEAENEAQALRLKAAADDEEFQRLKLDKVSSENEVLQLKNRLSRLERRLAEVTSVGVGVISTTSPGDAISDVSSIKTNFTLTSSSLSASSFQTPAKSVSDSSTTTHSDKSTTRTTSQSSQEAFQFDIPKLTPQPKSSSRSNISQRSKPGKRPLQNKCSICFKASYGIMKSCQCGNPLCDKRAHASCISGKNPLPSVSHPGTPAPALPSILCNNGHSRASSSKFSYK